nr:hypothetical protein [Pandoravirus massiliensis]
MRVDEEATQALSRDFWQGPHGLIFVPVIVVDTRTQPLHARGYGMLPLATTDVGSLVEAVVKACAQRDPDALLWQHVRLAFKAPRMRWTDIYADDALGRAHISCLLVVHGATDQRATSIIRASIPTSAF